MATIKLVDVLEVMERRIREAWESGQGWHYVRVHPDGSITDGQEVSRCIPESEYFRRGSPHTVTVWSQQMQTCMGEEEVNDVTEWVEQYQSDDATQALEQAGWTVE